MPTESQTTARPKRRRRRRLHLARELYVLVKVLWLLLKAGVISLGRAIARSKTPSPFPRMLRETLEALGGIPVKFGQFMAMRPDLVPNNLVREAEYLLDAMPHFPAEEARAAIEEEFGKPVDQIYRRFDDEPVAAASLGQVHKAELLDGTVVAVKILRPGIAARVRSDLRILRFIVWAIDLTGVTRRMRLSEVLSEFESWTAEELDLRMEAAFTTQLRESDVEIPGEYIPEVHWPATGEKVLTLEFLSGVWMSELKAAIARGEAEDGVYKGLDCRALAATLFENTLRQAFERGAFHADPHAGNLVALPDGRIGYVDFGITGHVDQEFRTTQIAILTALSAEDVDRYYRAVLRVIRPLPSDANIPEIRREIVTGARQWLNARFNRKASLAERGTARLMQSVIEVARKHELSVSNLAMRYFRAIVNVETLILSLDPEFPYRAALKSALYGIEVRTVRRRATPEAEAVRILGLLSYAQTLPDRVAQTLVDFDETKGVVTSSVNLVRSAAAWICRMLAWAAAAGALWLILAPRFDYGVFDLPYPALIAAGLAVASLFLANLARKLRLRAWSVSGG
ncbi:MAG: AarF/UbiB family protein [Rhodobacter sp.]|nr:AarF/UbiB family protein [Rhodobacter sp.]